MRTYRMNFPGVRTKGTILILAICIVSGLLMYFGAPDTSAEEIVDVCRDKDDKSTCYEREVPSLYPATSLQNVFDTIREIRELDPEYQFCHVLAHKLGELVVAEDPEKWLDAIPLNPPDGMCSNGFIHGVIGGRFRAEVLDPDMLEALIPDFSRACEDRPDWKPSGLDKAICYHGLGHLYDFITDADIPRALKLCKRTTPESMERVCIEGVFMQIYQPLEPDDFLLIERMPVKPSTTTVRSFCSLFQDDAYEGACLRESWPMSRKEIFEKPGGAEVFCSHQPNPVEEDACFEAVFSIVGRLSLGQPEKAKTICSAISAPRRGMCYSRTALAIMEENRSAYDDAVGFCANIPSPEREACAELLASRAVFVFGADRGRYNQFCSSLERTFPLSCAQ